MHTQRVVSKFAECSHHWSLIYFTILIFGSVRQIKLAYIGFWAHVCNNRIADSSLYQRLTDHSPFTFSTGNESVLMQLAQCWFTGLAISNAKNTVKGKVFPYSLPSVGPGADPGVQAVSPQVTWSESRHIPSSSLPLLSAGPAVTSVAFTRWRYL